MAKRKRPSDGGAVPPEKPHRNGVPWNVRIKERIDTRVRAHIEASRPPITLTGLIETAIEEYLDRIQASN